MRPRAETQQLLAVRRLRLRGLALACRHLLGDHELLRDRLLETTLVVDAGIGAPSHAARALELGYDAVLLNTAIAKAADPVAMARAFRQGVEAGRAAFEAGLMEARDFASPSTPVVGTPFWHAAS